VKQKEMTTDIVKGFENKTIGIVGLGYIGRHLLEVLKVHQERFNIQILCFNRKNIETVGDVEIDYLFNCAGYTGDSRSKPFETLDAHVNLPIFLLNTARIKRCFISLGSTRIYGFLKNKNRVFTENYYSKDIHTGGGYIYDGSKKIMESVLLNHAKTANFRIVIPRLSNVFGGHILKDLDDSTFLTVMLKSAISDKKIQTHQHTDSAKDFIFIDDAIEGILRTALFSKNSTCYNICSSKSYSIKEWADFLKIDIKGDENAPPQYSFVSNEKAERELGFKPKTQLNHLDFAQIIRANG
jgi:nucleoside-diphosphate-sugar epimerase